MELTHLSVLLVDDRDLAKTELAKALLRVGIDAAVTYCAPAATDSGVTVTLPAGRALDGFDIALIDVELSQTRHSDVEFHPEDLSGATKVLPDLRVRAPWLPIIGYSQLADRGAENFLGHAGSFGFDAFLPRTAFVAPYFDRRFWDAITDRARNARRRASRGDAFASESSKPTIDLGPQLASDLDSRFSGWRDLLYETFPFARKVVLERVTSGFSGATVVKVQVVGELQPAFALGTWLWKLSSSPSRLHEEAIAHLRMVRAGLPHAHGVQLLWREVLTRGRLASLAYQFLGGTQTGYDLLSSGISTDALATRVADILGGLYRNLASDVMVLSTMLSDWFPSRARFAEAATLLGDCDVGRLAGLLAAGGVPSSFGRSIKYSSALAWIPMHVSEANTHNLF